MDKPQSAVQAALSSLPPLYYPKHAQEAVDRVHTILSKEVSHPPPILSVFSIGSWNKKEFVVLTEGILYLAKDRSQKDWSIRSWLLRFDDVQSVQNVNIHTTNGAPDQFLIRYSDRNGNPKQVNLPPEMYTAWIWGVLAGLMFPQSGSVLLGRSAEIILSERVIKEADKYKEIVTLTGRLVAHGPRILNIDKRQVIFLGPAFVLEPPDPSNRKSDFENTVRSAAKGFVEAVGAPLIEAYTPGFYGGVLSNLVTKSLLGQLEGPLELQRSKPLGYDETFLKSIPLYFGSTYEDEGKHLKWKWKADLMRYQEFYLFLNAWTARCAMWLDTLKAVEPVPQTSLPLELPLD